MERVPYNALFLCTGNSARSIIAEALLNHLGQDRFRGFSAGSHPTGAVNPLVLEFLRENGIAVESPRSKSWDEFARTDAPRMDFIITVCDQAAGEACPIWPGKPIAAHWGVEDPARFMDEPERARLVIRHVFHLLRERIMQLASLPIDKLDRASLEMRLRKIGAAPAPD